jgi:hypothetical protein
MCGSGNNLVFHSGVMLCMRGLLIIMVGWLVGLAVYFVMRLFFYVV